MKSYAIFAILAFLLSLGQLSAQAERKIQLKVEKEIHGKITKIDSTIIASETTDIQALLKKMGFEWEEQGAIIELDGGKDGDNHRLKLIKIDSTNMITNLEEMDEETRAKVEAAMKTSGEMEMEVKVEKGEDGQLKVIVNGEELPADGSVNIFLHKEGESGAEEHIWIDKDETELKNIFFNKEGNEYLQLEGDHLKKSITLELTSDGTGGHEVVKIIKINCIIEDLHTEDEAAFRKAGITQTENNLSINDLSFYPNPNDGRFTLSFETAEEGTVDIRIVDVQGKSVYQEALPSFSGAYKGEINISAHPQGLYFLSISQNGKVMNKKIVIE